MNDLSNMIKKVYDYFQKQYGLDTGGLGPGSLFFAFEKLPITVSATDFKMSPQDPGFNSAIVLQHGSDLVNFCAEIDNDGFISPRGDISPAVDEQYNLLLNGAGPLSSTDGETQLFLQLKDQALQAFDNSKCNMNFTDFWPAVFTPQFWFNDQDPSVWTSYSSVSSQSTSAGSFTVRPIPLGEWRWRLVTLDMEPKWKAVIAAQEVPTYELAKSTAMYVDLSRLSQCRPTDIAYVASVLREVVLSPQAAPESAKKLVNLAENVNTDKIFAREGETILPDAPPPFHPYIVERPVADHPVVLSWIELQKAQLVTLSIKEYALKDFIWALPESPVSSSSFSIAFDYCLVNFSRPWLSANFINAPKWYHPGLLSGECSAGKYETGGGPLAFLPTKFLLIRNLNISAQWTQEDQGNIRSAACLGPFSLHDKSFDGVSLTCPGMQIIAWYCQIMPVLPPASDPSL